MSYSVLKSLLACCIFLSMAVTGRAADTTSAKYPAVLLVMLNSETNRIKAMEKAHLRDKMEIAKKDGEKERMALINDFTDHFHFCPVYYFVDTNLEAVKNKQFAGVLMNGDGSAAGEIPAALKTRNYMIVYYGTPLKQAMREGPVSADESTERGNLDFGRGLIACNDSMKQISYLYKFAYSDMFIRTFTSRKYYYFSKTFDLEYYPFAKSLGKRLEVNPYHLRAY